MRSRNSTAVQATARRRRPGTKDPPQPRVVNTMRIAAIDFCAVFQATGYFFGVSSNQRIAIPLWNGAEMRRV